MEPDVLEILLCHHQQVVGFCQKDIPALLVFCHVLVLAPLEIFKLCQVIALDPARLVEVDRLPAALCTILVQETVLNHLKLELPYGSDDFAAVELVDKELCHPFVHQLFHPSLQLFCLHRVGILDIFEHFGREAG